MPKKFVFSILSIFCLTLLLSTAGNAAGAYSVVKRIYNNWLANYSFVVDHTGKNIYLMRPNSVIRYTEGTETQLTNINKCLINNITLDAQGNLYILYKTSEFGGMAIDKFDANGTWIKTWSKTADGQSFFFGKVLAVDSIGSIYTQIADKSLVKLNPNNSVVMIRWYVSDIGGGISSIALDPQDNLFISFSTGISKFKAFTGAFAKNIQTNTFGGKIAADSLGNIYQMGLKEINKYNSDLSFLTIFKDNPQDEYSDIAVDDNGFIYVQTFNITYAASNQHSILKFGPMHILPSTPLITIHQIPNRLSTTTTQKKLIKVSPKIN